MNSNGTVNRTHKIDSDDIGLYTLSDGDFYGSSIANIGDLDEDGIMDIAVGAIGDNTGGGNKGAVYIHFMNRDGSIKENGTHKIASGTEDNGPDLSGSDKYGFSIANIGDLDGDGITDIAVGAKGDNTERGGRGAVYIHFMDNDGSIKATHKIGSGTDDNGLNLSDGDFYGSSIANIGDLNGDDIIDIDVGAIGDSTGYNTGGGNRGAVYIHFMNRDGSIKENETHKITRSTPNGPILTNDTNYGSSIANMGDLNGDGIMDMVVGARKTNSNDGAVYFSNFGMYCPKYMRHGKYFLNGTLRFKKSLK